MFPKCFAWQDERILPTKVSCHRDEERRIMPMFSGRNVTVIELSVYWENDA
jgi:hypothetical protein